MKISEFLSPADVTAAIRTANKQQLLADMSRTAAARLGLFAEDVASGLFKREDLGSTGMGGGVAIPHVRLPAVKRPFGMLATLAQPLDFAAIDGQAVDIVFLLLLPTSAEDIDPLVALASVARRLKSAGVLARLRAARSSAELYQAVIAG